MKYFIHLPMKMEPIVSSETSAIRTQTPGNYPKRNNLHSQKQTNFTWCLLQMQNFGSRTTENAEI